MSKVEFLVHVRGDRWADIPVNSEPRLSAELSEKRGCSRVGVGTYDASIRVHVQFHKADYR